MKTLGMILGMSYESSIHYYVEINKQVNAKLGNLNCARMNCYNVNFEDYRELMQAGEWDKIGHELAKIAKMLEQDGVDCVAIATNTMHKVADYVQSQINVPLIHIADCVARKCKEYQIYDVGLLGTSYTMTEDFLKERLRKNGLTVYTPEDEETINRIDYIIFNQLCKGIIDRDSKEYLEWIIRCMRQEKGIKGVILGCTELGMLIKPSYTCVPAIFDTTIAHIDSLVEFSIDKNS